MPNTSSHGVPWDLTEFFPSITSAEYTTFRDNLNERVSTLTKAASQLGPLAPSTSQPWTDLVLQAEEIIRDLGHISAYISCVTAEDANNETAKTEEARLSSLFAAWEKSQVPFKAMLKNANDDLFEALATQPALADARYALERLRHAAKYTMAPDMENLSADLGVDGLDAWDRLWGSVAGKLEFDLTKPDGTVERVPFAQKNTLLNDADPAVRKAALAGSNAAWSQYADVAAACLNGIAGTRLTLNTYRGIDHFLDVAMFQSGVERKTVEAMWSAVASLRDIPHRYLRHKTRLLGLERSGFQDLVAPLPSDTRQRVPWQDGVDRLLTTFNASYPALAEFSREMIDSRHIESEKRAGKRPGGFCTSTDILEQSRIFMTWGGTFDDLSTLAHELGHAWHARVLKGMRPLRGDYPMTLAETASTFAEDVLKRSVLSDPATDTNLKIDLLDAGLQDASVFMLNIHMRYIFEKAFYTERAEGEVSVTRLKELILHAQRECYGDALDPDQLDPWFWATKLHFYISGVTFYNFPYTFGYLLSRGLSRMFREEGESFLPRYEKFLRMTGSASAEDVAMQTLDIDLRGEEFWRTAIQSLTPELEEFERLTADRIRP